MYPRTASFTAKGNCETVAATCSRTLVLQLGVHREGHLEDVFQGSLLELALFHGGLEAPMPARS